MDTDALHAPLLRHVHQRIEMFLQAVHTSRRQKPHQMQRTALLHRVDRFDESGIFEEAHGDLWDQYLAVIHQRQDKLLALLKEPKTMEEIVTAWIVYRRPREPKELYAFAEQAIIQKHLDVLMADSTVVKKDGRYHRAAK